MQRPLRRSVLRRSNATVNARPWGAECAGRGACWLTFASDVRLKRLSVNRPDRLCGVVWLEGTWAWTPNSKMGMDTGGFGA